MSADVNDYSMSVYELEQNFTLALALMRIMVHVTYSVTSRVTGISIRRVGDTFCPETGSFSVGKLIVILSCSKRYALVTCFAHRRAET